MRVIYRRGYKRKAGQKYICTLAARRVILAACVLALVFVSGCSALPGKIVYPESAADGAEWDQTWLMHGNVLGIAGGEDFTLLENYAVLTMNGISTSVWGVGTPDSFFNEQGEEEENWYHAQIYVLAKECADGEDAQENTDEWAARLEQTWSVTNTGETEHNGHTYTVRTCESVSENQTYSRELAAFTCRGPWAVSVELDCRDSFSGDADAVLSAFLDGCHYNAALSS